MSTGELLGSITEQPSKFGSPAGGDRPRQSLTHDVLSANFEVGAELFLNVVLDTLPLGQVVQRCPDCRQESHNSSNRSSSREGRTFEFSR
jgi:hypothetical protein